MQMLSSSFLGTTSLARSTRRGEEREGPAFVHRYIVETCGKTDGESNRDRHGSLARVVKSSICYFSLMGTRVCEVGEPYLSSQSKSGLLSLCTTVVTFVGPTN